MRKTNMFLSSLALCAVMGLSAACKQEGDVYYTSTAPAPVTSVTAKRLSNSDVRITWILPDDENITSLYICDKINIDTNTWTYITIPLADMIDFYDFINAYQGFEYTFTVQTVSYDGTKSKPVKVTNSEVVSNAINFKYKRIDFSTYKIWVAVSDVSKAGISKISFYRKDSYDSSLTPDTILSDGSELEADSDGYYSFTVTKDGCYYVAVQYADTEQTKISNYQRITF